MSDLVRIGGTFGAPSIDMSIDIETLIGSHMAIIANSGGGKSGLIRKVLEATYGHVQHIILDGEDEFYTLREQYDYVIAGGDGGDVPATLDNAEDLALGALRHGFSLIAQVNDLGINAETFIGRFLIAMCEAPRALWHPVLIVVDEAQRFAPRLGFSDATKGIKDLLSRGRKRGFTAVIAGTKLTDIDPSVRGQVNNWMLGRVGQALDRNAMADALGFTPKEGRERLRGIAKRFFWGFGPAVADEPVLFHVDDALTTVVKSGDAKVKTPPAPEALREILAAMAKPEPESVSPKLTVADNAIAQCANCADKDEALTFLSAKLTATEEELSEARRERVGFSNDLFMGIQRLRGLAKELEERNFPKQDQPKPMPEMLVEDEPSSADEIAPPGDLPPQASEVADSKTRLRARDVDPDIAMSEIAVAAGLEKLTPADQDVLDKIRWAEMLWGDVVVPRHILAFLLGKHPRTKGLLNRWSDLKTRGYIEARDGGWMLRAKGHNAARAPAIKPTIEGVRQAVRSMLAPRQNDILDRILPHKGIKRQDLADALKCHVRAKGFLNDLSRLHSLGLVKFEAGVERPADFLIG